MIFGPCCLVFMNCICHIAFIMGTTSAEKFKLETATKARKIMKRIVFGGIYKYIRDY